MTIRLPRPAATLCLAVAAATFAACSDRLSSPASAPLPAPPSGGVVRLEAIDCSADVRAQTVRCGTPGEAGQGVHGMLIGGQNLNVKLTSTNIRVGDSPDPAERDTFSFDVTVQNLIQQPLGTLDGVSADPAGVAVFFASGPTTVGGSGRVVVGNPSGTDVFTSTVQPYFSYPGVLATNATTPPLRWKLHFDPGVAEIAFRAYVSAAVQYPAGWVDVGPGTLTLPRNGSGVLTPAVHDATGAVVNEAVTFASSLPAATIAPDGTATGICGGTTIVTASTATRPARLGTAVSVPLPARSGFSPDPYGPAAGVVPRAGAFSAAFSFCNAAANASTFVVHGSQSAPAVLDGTYSGSGTSIVTYSPGRSFFPGEEVEVSLTSALASTPTVARFRTAVAPASGTFPLGSVKAQAIPEAVALADFDGDGKLDMAVANQGSNSVSIALRNAANTGYDAAMNYAVGVRPVALAVADLNGDGKPDVVSANQTDNTVSVLLQHSTAPTFYLAGAYPTGLGPRSVAAADLNADGRADLAVANSDANTVSVLIRNAANTGYDDAVSYPVGTLPTAIAAADLTDDGRPDLVVANYGSSDVTVLAHDSTNVGFAVDTVYATGANPLALALGDLNGDGRLDLAVANSAAGTVSVLPSTSSGPYRWSARLDYPVDRDPRSLVIGDLDGNGRADIAVANRSSNTVVTLDVNGAVPGPYTATRYPAASVPSSIAAGDVNGDGRLDLAVGCRSYEDVIVMMRNASNDGYSSVKSLPAPGGAGSVALADLDGDGRLDVAAGTVSGVSIYVRNAANAGYEPVTYFATGGGPSYVAAGDLNGDGRLDLAAANFTTGLLSVLLRNDANTGFSVAGTYPLHGVPYALSLGDLNADGRLDVVVAQREANTISVLLRNAVNTGYDSPVTYAVAGPPEGVAIGDLNGDGRMDVAVAIASCCSGGSVGVLFANGTSGGLDAPVTLPVEYPVNSVTIADINGDGRQDVVAGAYYVYLLTRNAANTAFEAAARLSGADVGPVSIAAADVNGDGRLDLVAASSNAGNVSVILRDPSNSGYQRAVRYRVGDAPASVAVGDLNGDGRLDVVTANLNSANIALLESLP